MKPSVQRELLTLAAKAAGLVIMSWDRGVPMIYFDKLRPWNPIASKDQAKNLRHRLKITSGFDDRFDELGHCAYATYATGPNSCNSVMQNVDEAGGKNAASRLALVRAAAEMGRAMPVTDEESIATGLVKWFAEWELIIPQDAREALRPLCGQAAAIGMATA